MNLARFIAEGVVLKNADRTFDGEVIGKQVQLAVNGFVMSFKWDSGEAGEAERFPMGSVLRVEGRIGTDARAATFHPETVEPMKDPAALADPSWSCRGRLVEKKREERKGRTSCMARVECMAATITAGVDLSTFDTLPDDPCGVEVKGTFRQSYGRLYMNADQVSVLGKAKTPAAARREGEAA